MTNNSTGMQINKIQITIAKSEKDENSPNASFHPAFLSHCILPEFSTSFTANKYGELTATPGSETKEGTQLGSDKWGTEWKYHGSKSIHSYQHQILNRNDCGNYWKESVKLTQSLAEVATDKP